MSLTRRHFLASGAAIAGATALHPFSANAQAGQAHLRLMETTDLHVHVFPYDYYADRPVDDFGLARTAARIAEVRAEATNSLLLDNGDLIQGNPMGDYMAYEKGLEGGNAHPIIAAMNMLEYDAATLGNHEFNYGLDYLMDALDDAAFPVVSANVAHVPLGASPVEDDTLVPPYTVLDRQIIDGAGQMHPIRVGIIGFVPPQIMTWDKRHLEGRVQTRDIVEAARAWVPRLRAEGVDLVVALSHSGIEAPYEQGMENASLYVAEVDGIDVVMTGHEHRLFPGESYEGIEGVDAARGTLMGKPAVMANFWGSHMGLIDLALERDGESWRVTGFEVENRPIMERVDGDKVPLVESVPAVLDAARPEHEETLEYVRRSVGTTSAPLFSYFALVADDPSVQIVSQAQIWYIDQMMQDTVNAGVPILSAAAPFKSGGRGGPDYYTDVPAGDVAIRNVADLYLYPNTVQAVKLTGADVREWLERSAGMFNRIEPGATDAPLLNPDFPSYNFDVMDGVSYVIDLSQPSRYDSEGNLVDETAHRIVDLTYQGQPIDPDQPFIVATNNYRAGGGGSFPGIRDGSVIFVGPDTNRDVIVRYIVEQGTINPSADANWSFASMPGTSVTFETGPKARDYVDLVQGAAPEYVETTPEGFALFRLTL
ncbi:bifunctional 2',3'-cyclic nucleotide 2'-phosphodiesterase/3'-nucleotidase periplasmic precursor protein [Oceaniovalibus guishaninsula JLT2003]|uniref:Bifunctional 2',3'-cyclic nucleotide 2'-phosphodiesterase/3'-nucleotidase periplasmic protein n=1 Tax=Oceaniovalibus guishaninsula JLT2003 TaxID=1231392 RepID=K2HP92_9RHOB|nr:bifunctional 2',3'-cyclic-nucleotide 2'-phosphodiesterase/3'-nucleotidase [Oceaniovalibus guishaninsula]EKE44684.1 bifunctional 2',3'-cyclic nucleotide 2'-phosphodiesterase/3'-nucleotidase periplasmic precursor protein [Oceaniovalibus guishaninsula JLT2003]